MAEGLQYATITVCGIEIEIAGAADDRYFHQCAADGAHFEPAVAVAALTLPNDAVVVDCGASIGMVSAAIGRRFPDARIIAFEASPAVHPSTRATFERNGVFPRLVTSAVGAEPGELSFYVDGNGSGWGFLNNEIGGHTVPVVTLDDHLADLDRLDLLKLDIEGGELPALRGGAATIERLRPTLVVELNPFVLWRWGRTFPQDLLAWIEDAYPHLAAIDMHGIVTPLPDHDAAMELLYGLGVHGGLADIVATTEPLGLTTADLAPMVPAAPVPGPVASSSGPRTRLKAAAKALLGRP
ncbi:MAG: FkbM family methyltransferase [Actinomycetota bacterium]